MSNKINSIMPDEWRIPYAPGLRYAAGEDVKNLNKLAKGIITEEECIKFIEYHNSLVSGTLNHDQLIANMIWLGFFSVYKDHHTLTFQDVVIEHYFRDERAELVEKCKLYR